MIDCTDVSVCHAAGLCEAGPGSQIPATMNLIHYERDTHFFYWRNPGARTSNNGFPGSRNANSNAAAAR